MNFSFVRFIYGILGAILGAGVCLTFTLNSRIIIIISSVCFFVAFCWWEYIIKFLLHTDINHPGQ